MFVRVIDKYGVNTLRECDSVTTRALGDDRIMVTLARREVEIVSLDIEKQGSQIYIMNNEGRTVDSHDWSRPRDYVIEPSR